MIDHSARAHPRLDTWVEPSHQSPAFIDDALWAVSDLAVLRLSGLGEAENDTFTVIDPVPGPVQSLTCLLRFAHRPDRSSRTAVDVEARFQRGSPQCRLMISIVRCSQQR